MRLFAVCLSVFRNDFYFTRLCNLYREFNRFFGYDDYTQRIATIAGSGYTKEAKAFGPMQLSYFLIALAITWFGPLLKERYEGEVKYFNLWYFFAFIYGCGYFLICNTSHLFIRIVMFWSFIN